MFGETSVGSLCVANPIPVKATPKGFTKCKNIVQFFIFIFIFIVLALPPDTM
jgi:hypothetical protein